MERAILGSTGIEVSKLCFGTGTNGWNGSSDQTRLGEGHLAELLAYAYDCGVTFWDVADQYGSHKEVRRALQSVPREKVVITSKTVAKTAAEAQKDIPRFLAEMGTDYIDNLLLHCMTDSEWPNSMAPVMEVIDRFKSEGKIRAVGVSCHDFGAFKRAADEEWVQVVLARINYDGVSMCAPPDQVVPVIDRMHARGKGVYAMKVAGAGKLTGDMRKAFRYVLGLESIDALTIGMSSREEIDENIGLINELAPVRS